jgi:hypothetical protein
LEAAAVVLTAVIAAIMVSMLLSRVWLRSKGWKSVLYSCNRNVLPDRRAG